MRVALVIVLFAVACTTIATAQTSNKSSRKNLQRLKSSIETTRKRIDALQRRESSTMRSLSTVQRQRKQVDEIVRALESDLQSLQDSASVLENSIRATSTARQRTESAYSDLALAAITNEAQGMGYGSASDGNDDAFLMRYATEQVQRHRNRMLNRQDSLSSAQDMLTSTSTEHEVKLRERAAEGRKLASTISTRRKELERIRGDKSLLLKELAKKRSSASTLTAMIRKQEAASRAAEAKRQKALAAKRRAQAARTKNVARGRSKSDHTSAPNGSRNDKGSSALEGSERGPERSSGNGFTANSLPWPTQSRALIHGYGVYRNRETGTTLDNPGLDIRSPVGSRMTSVAPGIVSSVTWLPGFGSVVIVDHKNGFRTVYANLTSANVGVGASVQAGTVIGSSGESIDGPTAHFEVWRGREKQNPLTYLR